MSHVNRAVLFSTLAQYNEAGLTLDAALVESAQGQPSTGNPAARTAALLRSGMSLDKAGLTTRLLRPWEARLLAIGIQHGRLNLTLSEIARYYEKSANWWRKLRSKLVLPVMVLILGLLILPIPNLISGELSILAYIARNAVLAVLLWLAWRWMAHTDGYPPLLDRFIDRPPFGNLVWTYHRGKFLNSLALLIEAGMPAQEAVVGDCQQLPVPQTSSGMAGHHKKPAEWQLTGREFKEPSSTR